MARTITDLHQFREFISEVDNAIFTSSTRIFSRWNIAGLKLEDVDALEIYITTTLDRLSLTNDVVEVLLVIFLEALVERVCIIDWIMLESDDTAGGEFEEVALSAEDRRFLDTINNDNQPLAENTLAVMLEYALGLSNSDEEAEEPHEGWDEDGEEDDE